MTYRQSYKVTAPVARSTAYDFNAQLSKSHQRAKYPLGFNDTAVDCSNDEDRDVMPHEVLFEPKSRLEVSNARIHASSSVNGVKLGRKCVRAVQVQLQRDGCLSEVAAAFDEPMLRVKAGNAADKLAAYLSANSHARSKASDVLTSFFTYIGVAITPCKSGPGGGALQRQGYSASRGGLMTVVNTGDKPLRAGDRVRMVIDVLDVLLGRRPSDDTITGIPKTKIVARLVYVPERDSSFEDVADGITTNQLLVHINEPGPLTPALERVGRERYQWSIGRTVPDGDTIAQWGAAETAYLETVGFDTGVRNGLQARQDAQYAHSEGIAAGSGLRGRWISAGVIEAMLR